MRNPDPAKLRYRPLPQGRIHVYRGLDEPPQHWWVARWVDAAGDGPFGGLWPPAQRRRISYSFFDTWQEAWNFVHRG